MSSDSRFDFEGLEESLVDESRDDELLSLREALIRDFERRDERDLDLIENFVLLITKSREKSFLLDLEFMRRRLLLRHMVLAEIHNKNTKVLTNGETLDAFCIVAVGSLRHVTSGCVDCLDECQHNQRILRVGDDFGATLDDRTVFGDVFTNEDFVWVLCIPHAIFDEICGETRLRTTRDDSGRVIEVRTNSGELLRASRERLFELLFEEREENYISDFLLTFRLWFEDRDNSRDNSRDKSIDILWKRIIDSIIEEKREIEICLKIAFHWISTHFQDLNEKHFEILENSLQQKQHKRLLYFTLSNKSRVRHVTITRSDRNQLLPFALVGGYECGTRLFVSDVTEECKEIRRADRLISINGIDCHAMEVKRALQLCRQSTHLSLELCFDPNLFHLLMDGQQRRLPTTPDVKTTLQTTQTSFAALKPVQQLTSQQSSLLPNNWKSRVKQLVSHVTQRPTTEAPEVLKIYFENESRYLPLLSTTTAREAVQLALIEFSLRDVSSRDFALFEYRLLDGNGTQVKRLADSQQHLVESLALHSRLLLRQLNRSGPLETEITREVSKEMRVNCLLSLSAEEIARELTRKDLKLFRRIESQQLVEDLIRAQTDNDLKRFEARTERQLFWSATQVLTQCSLERRVKAIKQLVSIANFCLVLNNFNALFALLSGLSSVSVARLKSVWERIPQKIMKRLQRLLSLMDPSKNFHTFRERLKTSHKPLVPFFPLIKKDLQFVELANQTLTSEGVNWQKMRLLGRHCRDVTSFALEEELIESQVNNNSLKNVWEKQRMRKRVKIFLKQTFNQIICDENVLFEKSLQCEPQTTHERSSSLRSSQSSNNSSTNRLSGLPMPSPTPSSHSSSPSLSSSTTNSSDIPSSSSSSRLMFGCSDDLGLKKLLSLSDVSQKHFNSHQNVSSFVVSLPSPVVTQRQPKDKPLLTEESSSVTSLRRLEQIQQMSRFRQQFLPLYQEISVVNSARSRPLLPSYDQTIQRMKKKFNKNEENIV